MAFRATICEIDEKLFEPAQASSVDVKKNRAKSAKLSLAEELEQWRNRAEDIAKKYQELLQSYRKLKATSKEETEWRQRCVKMLQNSLRNCRDLELALAAAHKAGEAGPGGCNPDDPVRKALIAGIEQVVEGQLQQLHIEGMLDLIDPQRSELFDPAIHQAMSAKPVDDLAEGLIAEVAQVGYSCGGKAVRKAQVILAARA